MNILDILCIFLRMRSLKIVSVLDTYIIHLKMAFNDQISAVVNKLHDVGGLKFGDFMMKSGTRSPIYVDLRVIITHPKLLVKIYL